MMTKKLLITVMVLFAACSNPPPPTISKSEAIDLLNAGEVTEIGVSHSGWTTLTLLDGNYVGNRAEIIGYPRELLANCLECAHVSQWIE